MPVPGVSPGVAVADLFGGMPRRQLLQRMAQRGERDRHSLVALDRTADLDRAQRTRRIRLQHFFDITGIRAALRPWLARGLPLLPWRRGIA